MTIDDLKERRGKLGDELQRAVEQRDRLRGLHDEATTVCERMRGAVMLLDEMIAAEQAAMPVPVVPPETIMPAIEPAEVRAA